jgi:hypothetical protein
VAGDFTDYNGTPRNGIIRLNADGTLDASFNPGTGFDNTPGSLSRMKIQLQPDGKIVAGGVFMSYNGVSHFPAIRINADGTRDNTFLTDAVGLAYNVLLLPSGDILLRGTTRVYGASAAPTITSFTPLNAMTGAMVTITGTNFCGVSAVSLGGTAAASFTVDSPTQITAVVGAGATGSVSVITPLGTVTLTGFTFLAPPSAAYTATTFPEAAANNGTITQTRDVTLTSDTWLPAAAFANPTDFTATGVPTGLAIAINRISATVARISFTGAAAAHASANNATVTLNFTNAALTSGNAAGVTGLNPAALSLNFTDPPPPPPPAPPVPPTAFQLGAAITLQASLNLPYGLSLIANGSPAPVYTLVGGALPNGMSLSLEGRLSGLPTQQGVFTFTVQASNIAGSTPSVITVVVTEPRPLVTQADPSTGSVGTTIILRGYNFTGATDVRFGGVSALSFTVDNDSQITAIVGFGNSGVIQVTTPNGTSSAPQGFTYITPPPPAITSVNPAAAVSGDENYRIVLRGRNFSPFATYSVQPETGTSASFAVPLETVQEFVSSTEAHLRLPLASRTLGVKRVTLRLGDAFASGTFAVVPGTMPQIVSQTVPSTIASSQAFTTELSGTGFFRFGYGRLTVNGELANASVVDARRARVEIPARWNILGSKIAVRITNYDGQFAETTLNVVSRVAPFIAQVVSRLEDGRIRMIVRGSGFWGVQSVLVQNQSVLLVRTSPAELEIELPRGFPRPSLTEEAWVLLVENPDGQKYGFRLTPSLFYPPNGGSSSSSSNAVAPKVGAETQSANAIARTEASIVAGVGQMNISPNPVSEMLTLDAPAFTGVGRLSILNARGEEVFAGAITGGERSQVDVRSLPSGVYVVRVVGEGVRVVSWMTVVR